MSQPRKRTTVVKPVESWCQIIDGERMTIANLETQNRADQLKREAKYGRQEATR